MTELQDLYDEGDAPAAESFGRLLTPNSLMSFIFTRSHAECRFGSFARQSAAITCSVQLSHPHRQLSTRNAHALGRSGMRRPRRSRRCSACAAHGLGVPKPLARLLPLVPRAIRDGVAARGLSGGAWTGVRLPELITLRHDVFRALTREVDHIVALCDWVRTVLLRNDVPSGKITVSRQGLADPTRESPTSNVRDHSSTRLRAAYFGRLDPVKGVDLVIGALRSDPALQVSFDIYGVAQGGEGASYAQRLRSLSAGDERIRFFPHLDPAAVVDTMRAYDVITVPSRCLETGPLVVMEAFAAGVPVVGANLGGISELVRNGRDGLLIDPSTSAWQQVLARLTRERDELTRMRANIPVTRSIADVASDMQGIYRRVISKSPVAVSLTRTRLIADVIH